MKKREWNDESDLPCLELLCLSALCLLGNVSDKRTEDSWELLNSKLKMESCIWCMMLRIRFACTEKG